MKPTKNTQAPEASTADTSVAISADLLEKITQASALEGITLEEFVRSAVQDHLADFVRESRGAN